MLRLSSHRIRSSSLLLLRTHRYSPPRQRQPVPRTYPLTTPSATRMASSSVGDIVSQLASLDIKPHGGKLVAHESSTSPASWRDALSKTTDVPASYELVKTLVFKPKTSKTAPQTPLIVIAREETETSSAALGRKYNLKDLRLAPEELLQSLFGVNKDACMLL